MRTTNLHTGGRFLAAIAFVTFGAHCGAESFGAADEAATSSYATPTLLARLGTTPAAAATASPSMLAIDSVAYIPSSYAGAPVGTAATGVFSGSSAGISEWFDSSTGSQSSIVFNDGSVGAIAIDYSASVGEGGNDTLIAAVRATEGGASVVKVYEVGLGTGTTREAGAEVLGGALPLGREGQVRPSVVGASSYDRLVIAGEGACGAANGDESYVYGYTAGSTSGTAPGDTGIVGWQYVLDASGKTPACAIGLALDNARSEANVPGEVTFLLHADGSVEPWLTHTTVWGDRTSWKVPGAVAVAAYNQRVALLDGQGNVYFGNPYDSAAPTLLYATGAQQECGGEVTGIAFDVTDGRLVLEMQDTTAGGAPVVCYLAQSSLQGG